MSRPYIYKDTRCIPVVHLKCAAMQYLEFEFDPNKYASGRVLLVILTIYTIYILCDANKLLFLTHIYNTICTSSHTHTHCEEIEFKIV